MTTASFRHAPADQAEGLRRLFGAARPRFVPVVSNPHLAFGGVVLERLCTAFGERGGSTLVVDAGERASEADEMATIDLGQCIETLQPAAPSVSYLAARNLALRFVDATGSTVGLLHALADAAPQTDAVLVHAPATDLARLFPRPRAGAAALDEGADATPCPIVLASDHPASVTHAYAAMKWLAGRSGHVVFDLVVVAARRSPRAARIGERISTLAELYFGGVVRRTLRLDPATDAAEPPSLDLRRLAADRLGARYPAAGHGRPASLHPTPRVAAPRPAGQHAHP